MQMERSDWLVRQRGLAELQVNDSKMISYESVINKS